MGAIRCDDERLALHLSGERFAAIYELWGNEKEAQEKAQDICYEQTVEFPGDLLPEGVIKSSVVGKIEAFLPAGQDRYRATILFAVETAGKDITQLLNVAYGNISIKPGIRLVGLELPASMLADYPGPRFGRRGLRKILGIPDRPLSATALKPMGLSPKELADQACEFALGGIDIIKDDHGLADQKFCPFMERVARCAEAVKRANQATGFKSIYMPNVTSRQDRMLDLALEAKRLGAGGLLVSPMLCGMDSLALLAEAKDLDLPILAHPSFGGIYANASQGGISHGVLYGTLPRLLGADATVYPNFGGRFSFSKEECMEISGMSCALLGNFEPMFPAPGGGMTLERTEEMIEAYGKDFILLVGSGLHRGTGSLRKNAERLIEMLSKM